MPRDGKGRFSKEKSEGFQISLNVPSFKKILYLIFIISLLMSWITIILRFNILNKIFHIFEGFMIINQMKIR